MGIYLAPIALIIFTIFLIVTLLGKKDLNRYIISSTILLYIGISLWQISLFFLPNITQSILVPRFAFIFGSWSVIGGLGLSIFYPNNKGRSYSRVALLSLFVINLIFSFIIYFSKLIIADYSPAKLNVTFGPLGIPYFGFLFILVIGMVANFIYRYRREKISRFYFKYVFIAFSIYGLLALVLNLVLPILGYTQLTTFGAMSAVLPLISIEYSLIGNRLYKTNYLLGKTVLVFIWGAFFFIVAFGINLIELEFWGSVTSGEAILTGIVIALIFAALFIPLFQRSNRYLEERILYGKYPPSKALEELSIKTSTELETEKILKIIKDAIVKVTGSERTLIVIYRLNKKGETSQSPEIIIKDGDIGPDFISKIDSVIQGLPPSSQSIVSTRDIEMAFDQKKGKSIISSLRKYRMIVSLGKISGNKGIIILGKKASMEPYTVQDTDFLKSMRHISSTALERAILYHEVRRFNVTLQQKVDQATSDLKERNQELQDLYMNLEELYQKEKDLMDIAGHELRTPASILKTNLYLLKNRLMKQYPTSDKDEKIAKYLDRLVESTERQIRLVNTFLESARIENKKFDLNFETADFAELITKAVEDVQHQADEKNLRIIYTPPAKKLFIDMDALRIREVIDNLLSNAVKYTTKGYVEVKITETNDMVSCSVKDTGIGIKESDIPILFKKFSRVSSHIEDSDEKLVRPGGTGLGLFVSKNVIDAHKGHISVESEFGKGSTFTFEIPKKQSIPAFSMRPSTAANLAAERGETGKK